MSNSRQRLRLGALLLGAGAVGLLSLLLVPVERILPPEAVAGLPPLLLRASTILNPLILLIAATAAGVWAAPRVGLTAPLFEALAARRPLRGILAEQIPAAALGAVAAAAVLIFYSVTAEPAILADVPDRIDAEALTPPLLTRLLYGGVTEEIIARWGVMSLLARWGVMSLLALVFAKLMHRNLAMGLAIALSALLFAASHLPMLYFILGKPEAALVLAVLAGNAAPGAIFGWLFWQRGLEAAMIAHAGAHLIAWVAAALFLAA